MFIDWDILKMAAIINAVLAAFWKLREITIAQILGKVFEKFVTKEDLREELRVIRNELHHH